MDSLDLCKLRTHGLSPSLNLVALAELPAKTLDTILFLKESLNRHGRKPIWTSDAVWCPEACKFLTLEHHVYPVEWKNLIERMNQTLKDRLENFDDPALASRDGLRQGFVNNRFSIFRFFQSHP